MMETQCKTCSINKLCLPVMLEETEIDHLDSIVKRGKPLHKNEHLIRAGQPLESIYAIRSGSLKSYTVNQDGIEQITGFYLPGEIVGLDAIHSGEHPSFIVALETSSVCNIPFDSLEQLSRELPGLQSQVLRVMSREINADQQLMMLLNKKSAEERLAAFILNLSSRFSRRGLSSTHYRLSMTRSDIGNYLGLAVETVSRLVGKLQNSGLVNIHEKEVEVLDLEALTDLAGADCLAV